MRDAGRRQCDVVHARESRPHPLVPPADVDGQHVIQNSDVGVQTNPSTIADVQILESLPELQPMVWSTQSGARRRCRSDLEFVDQTEIATAKPRPGRDATWLGVPRDRTEEKHVTITISLLEKRPIEVCVRATKAGENRS